MDELLESQLALQETLHRTISVGYLAIGPEQVSAVDAFQGLGILLRVFKDCARWKGRWPLPETKLVGYAGTQNELSRIKDRIQHSQLLGILLGDWPQAFIQLGNQVSMVQLDLLRHRRIPKWVLDAADALAPGVPRFRRKPIRQTWGQELLRLQRERAPGWRTKRAELLMLKARNQ
jgi:hypothetical protein